MAQVVALLQSDAGLLRCQLHRIGTAVDLGAVPGKVVGVGYYENGKVLLRKRPAGRLSPNLEALGEEIKSECFVVACHGVSAGVFREEDTEPYRFRSWVFAGTGRIVPVGERAKVTASLPTFMQRGLVGPSDAELAFMTTLGHIYADTRTPEHPDLDPEVAARGLAKTLAQLDAQANASRVAMSQTCAVLTNGRMLAAVRRGRPLSYALLEGIAECSVCGIDRTTSDRDPRVRPHRMLKAVVLASRTKQDGVQWVDVPDNHLITVSRSLAVRVVSLQ
jgi:predicted glutamine amidotransferase